MTSLPTRLSYFVDGMDAEVAIIDACVKSIHTEIAEWVRWWNALPWYKQAAYALWWRTIVKYNRMTWTIRMTQWTAYRLLRPVWRVLV